MYELKDITVKKYMTQKATASFTFMKDRNNDTPMPFLRMCGFKLKETKGMVYMRCRGEVFSEREEHCVCCGRPITNPVSQYFGIGPICGGHDYTNPFSSEKELRAAVRTYRENYLHEIKWEGWIPKSAIVRETPYIPA